MASRVLQDVLRQGRGNAAALEQAVREINSLTRNPPALDHLVHAAETHREAAQAFASLAPGISERQGAALQALASLPPNILERQSAALQALAALPPNILERQSAALQALAALPPDIFERQSAAARAFAALPPDILERQSAAARAFAALLPDIAEMERAAVLASEPRSDLEAQPERSGKSRSRPAHQPYCAVRTDRTLRRVRRGSLTIRASLGYRRRSHGAVALKGKARCRTHGVGARMKTTWYFDNRVLLKRPEIDPAWCLDVIAAPLRTEVQADGRIRFWGEILLRGEDEPRIMRVVTLEDGETIHNAFLDRDFRRAGTP